MGLAKNMTLGSALSLSACVGNLPGADAELSTTDVELAPTAAARYGIPLELDVRRSLVVTEQPILERFSFERVMGQLVSQARVRGLTSTRLFQQWWDTQNPSPGSFEGPHCDDEVDPELGPMLNGYPYTCRPAPAEGGQASCDPFSDPACSYIPIGLFSRFDLAPEDGSSCGEYRIVFAKTSGQTNRRDRNLLIFEASLPNPAPRRGLAGCRPIVDFWAGLSRVDDLEERARRLERFYFRGLGRGVGPVVDIHNYGDNPAGRGQIRTNQFVQDGLEVRAWSLREFKLEHTCEARGRWGRRHRKTCSLTFRPDTNKGNPYGPLFAPSATDPRQQLFQELFLDQLESLTGDDVGGIAVAIEDQFNSGQSQASGSTETDSLVNFGEGGAFEAALDARLAELGSQLEPVDVIARAETQTCAGCHRFSNGRELGGGLVWPSSLGFTHVSERDVETVDGVARFAISEALTTTFLPQRKQLMSDFLENRIRHGRRYGSVGGHHTH